MSNTPLHPGVGPGAARRAIDVIAAGLSLVVLSPLLAVLAVAVRLSSPGPAIFRQERVGQGGTVFTLFKFRSMRSVTGGPDVTVPGDARITRVGRFMRATSLDELPQLFNVLKGDMTLVGPRPETPALASRYPEDCQVVFRYRPGLTGPAQLRHRDTHALPAGLADPEAYYLTALVPARTALDLEYLARPTLVRTFGWMLETVADMFGLSTAAGRADAAVAAVAAPSVAAPSVAQQGERR